MQKIGSLKELFNSPINEVSFDIKSHSEVDEISKILKEDGKTFININMTVAEKELRFKLKNTRNLDRKSLNLLRNENISSTIS